MIALHELKEHLRLPPDHTAEDAYIVGLELAAVSAIQTWTGRYFGTTEEVSEEVYSGGGFDTIWLSETPGTVTMVETWDGSAWTEVDAADYTQQGFALYHATSYWPTGSRNVRVTYERGYAPGEEPWGVRQAVLLLVGAWYQNREAVSASSLITSEMPLSVKALIAPYRRIKV